MSRNDELNFFLLSFIPISPFETVIGSFSGKTGFSATGRELIKSIMFQLPSSFFSMRTEGRISSIPFKLSITCFLLKIISRKLYFTETLSITIRTPSFISFFSAILTFTRSIESKIPPSIFSMVTSRFSALVSSTSIIFLNCLTKTPVLASINAVMPSNRIMPRVMKSIFLFVPFFIYSL